MDQKMSEILCINICDCKVFLNAYFLHKYTGQNTVLRERYKNCKGHQRNSLVEESGNILLYF
jgi:hypothetical protein